MTKIGFVGDLMFGDQPVTFGYGFNSQHSSNNYSGIFDGVNNYLHRIDMVVGNFESIIRKLPLDPSVTNYSMCCAENITYQLLNSNLKILSLANNHTMEYGEEGYKYTKKILEESGITIIGDKEQPWTIISIDGKEKVGIFAASYIRTTSANPCYLYFPNESTLESIIDKMKQDGANKIFAYIHWGNEFVTHVNKMQIDVARQLAQLGVDLIVGCHSHILQPTAHVQDIPVVFSLGNFISDYWQKRIRNTEILEVDLNDGELSIIKTNCIINKYGCPIQIESTVLETENTLVIATKNQINSARWQMRVEYLSKLLLNFHRIRNKSEKIKWFLKRLKYILGFMRRELRDPDVIYEQYEN